MSTTMTIEQDIQTIEASAASKKAASTETIGTASIGDTVRQGDLYLVNLGSDCPFAKGDMKPNADQQLAPGSTQGSRHVMVAGKHFTVPTDKIASAIKKASKCEMAVELLGGVIYAGKGCTITHPEHGHKVLPEGDYWAVVFQRQYAEDARRVQD